MQEDSDRVEAHLVLVARSFMPPGFVLFIAVALVGGASAVALLGWRTGIMTGFDIAAAAFCIVSAPLLRRRTDDMRRSAERNDANRILLLAMTLAVLFVILVTVAAELEGRGKPAAGSIALVVVTLVLAWTFTTIVYAMHYAHLFYLQTDAGKDQGGLEFPGETEPDYWDFLYFSCTMGMTFQTSDVEITSFQIRRVVLFHALGAFVFNLGVIAFTVNVLGSG